MKRHFDDELKRLKEKLFRMGLLVEEAIRKAVQSLIKRDSKLAEGVIEGDQRITRFTYIVDLRVGKII